MVHRGGRYAHRVDMCVYVSAYIQAEFTRVCVYIYIYARRFFMCVFIYVHIGTPSSYMCVNIYLHVHRVHRCVFIYLYICTPNFHVGVYMFTNAHRFTGVCAYITYMHTEFICVYSTLNLHVYIGTLKLHVCVYI